jgi:hypothetical protein
MIIKIEFPFVDRNQTANKKNKRTKNVYKTILKNEHKEKCETFAYLAKKNYKIESPFYGAILHRFWFFKNRVPKDYDNFCAGTKYYTDALISQGIILKDDNHHLLIGNVHFLEKQPSEKIVYVLYTLDEQEFKVINKANESNAIKIIDFADRILFNEVFV